MEQQDSWVNQGTLEIKPKSNILGTRGDEISRNYILVLSFTYYSFMICVSLEPFLHACHCSQHWGWNPRPCSCMLKELMASGGGGGGVMSEANQGEDNLVYTWCFRVSRGSSLATGDNRAQWRLTNCRNPIFSSKNSLPPKAPDLCQ